MRAAGGEDPTGHVCRLASHHDMARGLRTWLWNAGVRREQLHVGSSVSKQVRWHDMRATGATWLAVEGRSATEIRDVLGHTQTSMTDHYMRNAAILRGGRFGDVFPPLPPTVVTPKRIGQVLGVAAGSASNSAEILRRGRDSNPRSGFPPTLA